MFWNGVKPSDYTTTYYSDPEKLNYRNSIGYSSNEKRMIDVATL